MSRNYVVEVETKGISLECLRHAMTKRFGWVELDAWEHKGITHFEGEGCLCGGESEEEAHSEISKALKETVPGARVKTKWTYLDERPYTVYGDALE